nr:unnamed protein product [Callosobruchus chinensis]
MATVDQILDYKKKEEEDYYAILGCDENSTIEQIQAEYKVRALQYHPDKNEGNKEAEQKFQLLNEAKDVLCTPEKKCLYDKWKNSGIAISYKQWLGMKEHVQQVCKNITHASGLFLQFVFVFTLQSTLILLAAVNIK